MDIFVSLDITSFGSYPPMEEIKMMEPPLKIQKLLHVSMHIVYQTSANQSNDNIS